MSERSQHVQVQVVRLPHAAGLDLPAYQTAGSAGMDLVAAIDINWTIQPKERLAVPTGLTIALPEGHEAQVRPRSGLALEHGLTVANAPGTVDSDFRGEIKVILINLSDEEFTIQPGDRIAQLVISPVARGQWAEVDQLPPSTRGQGGFGHTGR